MVLYFFFIDLKIIRFIGFEVFLVDFNFLDVYLLLLLLVKGFWLIILFINVWSVEWKKFLVKIDDVLLFDNMINFLIFIFILGVCD